MPSKTSFKFATFYIVGLVLCIALGGSMFGLVINHISEKANEPNQSTVSLGNLISVGAAIQSLWIAVASLVLFLIFRGLVSISDGLVKTIFKVIGILCLLPLNIWLLVDGILILSNMNNTNNIVMTKTIYGVSIATAVFAIITSAMFLLGLVIGLIL